MPDGITISSYASPASAAPPNVLPVPAELAPPRPAMTPMQPNPSYRIDPSLNMVVIEFIGDGGVVKSSLPTPRQLDAYQRSAARPDTPPASLLVKT